MADTKAKATTTPKRSRKSSSAKAAPATTPVQDAADEQSSDGRQRIRLALEPAGETKSYAVFTPPANCGCVGKFYAPLGTEEVKVLLVGPNESE